MVHGRTIDRGHSSTALCGVRQLEKRPAESVFSHHGAQKQLPLVDLHALVLFWLLDFEYEAAVPMSYVHLLQECHDEIEEDDDSGRQQIFRIVRIPFRVSFITGNLKLRLRVEQSPKTGEVGPV